MTVTTQSVTASVRRLLQDNDPNYPRFSDGDIRASIRLAVLDMRRIRPDLFTGTLADIGDARYDEDIPVDEEYETPLVYISCAHVAMNNRDKDMPSAATEYFTIGKTSLVKPL